MQLSFTIYRWKDGFQKFGKKVRYTIDVVLNGKKKVIIFVPEDGSQPRSLDYSEREYPEGILDGKIVEEIIYEYPQYTQEKLGNQLVFSGRNWNGDLKNFSKRIRWTIFLSIGKQRLAVIYLPEDGSMPKTMQNTNNGYPPGILSGKVIDDILDEHDLPRMMEEVYGSRR